MPTNINVPQRLSFLEEKLASHLKLHERRELSPFEACGRINFGSNDYLGLKDHPFIKSATIEAIQKFGTGAGASRYVSGNHPLYEKIESNLASLTGYESALLFNSCYQLNQSIFRLLVSKQTTVFADKWIHRSLIEGIQTSSAHLVRYPHQDLKFLENALRDNNSEFKWIVTESLFGMDGDVTDLHEIIRIAQKYNATLVVDDAHSFGLGGKNGLGFCSGLKGIDLVVGGFGKGGGVCGGYLLSSKFVVDALTQLCPALIYTTALPPMVLAAIDAALTIIPGMDVERKRLTGLADEVRILLGLPANGIPIIPHIVGSNERVEAISQSLKKRGLYLPAIRSPTVPVGTARLRISLNHTHSDDEIVKLKMVLKELNKKHEIQRRFGAASRRYSSEASVQQQSADRLARLIPEIPSGPILEIGCGTGFLSQHLIRKFSGRDIQLTDLSPEMCCATGEFLVQNDLLSEGVTIRPLDGELLKSDQKYALIVSNMSFQWFNNLPAAIENLKNHLLPGGKLMFSTLDDSSFFEWKAECLRLKIPYSGNSLPAHESLESRCSLKCHLEEVVEYYERPIEFFQHLKKIGASTSLNQSVGSLQKLLKQWQAPTTITYRVLYAVS